jgi:hypothetical protein
MNDVNTEDTGPAPDEWDALLERLQVTVDEIYADDTIDALIELTKANLGRYVRFRERLGEIKGFRAKEYEDRFKLRKAKQSSFEPDEDDDAQLLAKISEEASYFIAADSDEVYAEFPDSSGHTIICSIHGKQYRRRLIARFKLRRKRAPGRDAVKICIDGVDADATEAGIVHPLYIRVGSFDDKIYVDRGTPEWDAIEIDGHGWRVVSQAPCKFYRPPSGIGVMPIPEEGGDITALWGLLNLASEQDFILFLIWVLSCYRPISLGVFTGEYGMLLIIGEHGSAKTSALKAAVALVDPLRTKPKGPPREERDVLVAAKHAFVLSMDNLKHISVERAATLCRLLSGASNSGRALYTDDELTEISALRPVVGTATSMVVTEVDLFDRLITIFTAATFEGETADLAKRKKRKTSAQLGKDFEAAWPRMLGCVLDAVSAGLRNHDMPEPPELPRLADLAYWAHRCEAGFNLKPGTMVDTLLKAVKNAAEDAAEHDPVASAVIALMVDYPAVEWKGTATDLWSLLKNRKHGTGFNLKDFPGSPSALSRRLGELRVTLLRNKLALKLSKTNGDRQVVITKVPDPAPGGTP